MRRLNSPAGCLNTGMATLDLGDGLTTELPLGKSFIVRETAGRTVSIWDYLNNREQMIYGDTGEREVGSLLKTSTATSTLISREENRVFLSITGLIVDASAVAGGELLQLPNGFRPSYQVTMGTFDTTGKVASLFVTTLGRLGVWTGMGDGFRRNIQLSWRTKDPWPTTLPGVAA